jgi:hypothetical protein
MAKQRAQTPGRLKRWLKRLKQRNERASAISQRAGAARGEHYDHRGGGDGGGGMGGV